MLYLCATPIGNLGDITLRVIETLRACDIVYCEDTRRTAQLLNHLEIKKPLKSCHEHSEKARAVEVVADLRAGLSVVYVSDAGMPAVSDPGAILVAACLEHGQPYTVLPGASAVLTAAVMSGLPPQPFTFFGFLPRESKPRKAMLAEMAVCQHLILLYESPHRVLATLSELHMTLGDCRAAVMRELTKKFEEVRRGRLSELCEAFSDEPRGECVLAIMPERVQTTVDDAQLNAFLTEALHTQTLKDAAAAASQVLGVPKKRAYARALMLTEPQVLR